MHIPVTNMREMKGKIVKNDKKKTTRALEEASIYEFHLKTLSKRQKPNIRILANIFVHKFVTMCASLENWFS